MREETNLQPNGGILQTDSAVQLIQPANGFFCKTMSMVYRSFRSFTTYYFYYIYVVCIYFYVMCVCILGC